MFKFEELRVYQESIKFVNYIYTVTDKWPKNEIFGLTDQFKRASVSIALNIYEWSEKLSRTISVLKVALR